MSSLPGLLGDIADIVGPEIALEIARQRGGTRVSIPASAEPDHWLTELVGPEIAEQICKGLSTIDGDGRRNGIRGEIIPLGPASAMRAARQRAQKALDEGASGRAAAREAGLHERTIWRMKAKDKDQGSLF